MPHLANKLPILLPHLYQAAGFAVTLSHPSNKQLFQYHAAIFATTPLSTSSQFWYHTTSNKEPFPLPHLCQAAIFATRLFQRPAGSAATPLHKQHETPRYVTRHQACSAQIPSHPSDTMKRGTLATPFIASPEFEQSMKSSGIHKTYFGREW